MAKQKGDAPTTNAKELANLARITDNVATMRTEFLKKLLDPRRDIDDECGYPKVVDIQSYRLLYDREGIAERVVNVYPQESWAMDPDINESEDAEETEFERAWKAVNDEHNCIHYLQRIDELSGIGHYGVLLLGLDDGEELQEPADGLDEQGNVTGDPGHQLLYLRAFDESLVNVAAYETDLTNPRFGTPTFYDITFYDPNTQESGGVAAGQDTTTRRVHWSRVIHVADNRKSSEVFGVPRMRPVYNRLYDLRKLLGGSAEMFWKGAFPGYSFEVNPDLDDVTIDKDAMRIEFDNYANGLQRYLALTGVQAKSLGVQVADPSEHVEAQLRAIAITLGVPLRVFMGSEQAQLASGQDARAWNKRLERRQTKYVDPMIIRPFIDRLIAFGILPEPVEYFIEWPDLNSPTDQDKAEVAAKKTEAFAKYVAGGVDTLIPPLEFLTIVCGMKEDEAEAIMEAAIEHIIGANPESNPDEVVPARNPTPPALAEATIGDEDEDEEPIPAGVKPKPEPAKEAA